MTFHLGKPILVMLCVALLTGVAVGLRPPQRKADLTLWVFADSHRQSYRKPLETFQSKQNLTVNLDLVVGPALDLRLNSLFMTDPYSSELPDLAELEINWVGKYLRPPL